MGGILVAGILGGLFIGQMNNTPPPDPTPPPTPRPGPVVTAADVAPSRPPTPPPPPAATVDVTQVETRDAATATSQRGAAIVLALRNSRIVDTCWQQHLRQNPGARATRVAVDVSVDTQGHATTITVSDSPDARFERCVRDRIDAFGTVGPGDAMDARTSFELDVSN
jgi:hypothetical protein